MMIFCLEKYGQKRKNCRKRQKHRNGNGVDGKWNLDSSLKFHLQNAKNHGVTREEIAEILTHAAFYAGWPKAWAAFRMAKEVWTEE